MGKRKQFTIEEKGNVIFRLRRGEKNVHIAKELGVGHSTISSMWKDREKIEHGCRSEKLSMKKLRNCTHKDLEIALLRWCKNRDDRNTPVSGPTLLRKANELAAGLGKHDFNCSVGWIQRFRLRNNILFTPITGDMGPIDGPVIRNWLDVVWPKLREGYADEQIYNADEAGIFFEMLPNFKFKEETNASGGRRNIAERRLTVLVAASMTGRKIRPIVIGKYCTPQCFAQMNVNSLPVRYVSDPKAWMTSALWAQILWTWDAELGRNGENILLVVDNSPAHSAVALLNIKLVVLPSYSTSILQPMSQGITKCLKMRFRKSLMQMIVDNVRNEIKTGISVLDGILMIVKAWENIPISMIQNCFQRAGFHAKIQQEIRDKDNDDDDDDIKDNEEETGMLNIEDYVNMSINICS